LHRAEVKNRQVEAMLHVSRRLEAVGSMAATLVHDFNNMLAVIRGFTDLARYEQTRNDALVPERLADIDSAVARANAMVRQLSLFLQRRPDAAAPADVGSVVRELEPLLRQAATSRVDFTLTTATTLPLVLLDRAPVEQALLNLVMNARDALTERADRARGSGLIPPQEIVITVEERRLHRYTSIHQARPQTGSFVCISVLDTGCGIEPKDVVTIFNPFFTTKPAGQGMGLGLASVLHTAQQHGGWVEVESTPGAGARFDFYLPAVVAGAAPARPAAEAIVVPAVQCGVDAIPRDKAS
jgi:signal transduction histidine kinase